MRPVTRTSLLDMLQQTLVLRYLELGDALDIESFAQPMAVRTPLNLAHITKLRPSDHIVSLVQLLELISVPRQALISITEVVEDVAFLPHGPIDAVLTHLGACPHLNHDAGPHAIAIQSAGNCFILTAKTCNTYQEQLHVLVPLDGNGRWDGAAPTAAYIFKRITLSLSFAELVTLHFHNLDDWKEVELVRNIGSALQQMSRLERLDLRDLAVGGFLIAMWSTCVDLPRLIRIHIAGCDLAELASPHAPEGITLLDLLHAFVSTRAHTGQPSIKGLHMWQGCYYGGIKESKALVGYVKATFGSSVLQIREITSGNASRSDLRHVHKTAMFIV
jgi:hypothetical protein